MSFEVLTKKEAADRARCSLRFLELKIKSGELAVLRLGSRKTTIRSDSLQDWLERRTVPSRVAA